MKARYFGLILLLALLCAPVMAAWSDNMNNGEVVYYSDLRCNGHGGCGQISWGPIPGYSDTYGAYTIDRGSFGFGPAPAYLVTPNFSGTSNYFAYTMDRPYSGSGIPAILLYGSTRNLFFGPDIYSGTPGAMADITPPTNTLHRYEAVRTGTTINTYMDGTLNNTFEGIAGTPAYSFGMGSARSADGVAISGYYDDPSFGNSFSTTALVSVMPHSWYIKSDMIDSSNFAMIDNNGNQVYSDHFDVQWSLGAYADGWQASQNPPNNRYRITIAAPDGSIQVYNQNINITAAGAAAGIVSVLMNNTYIGNYPLEYGRYGVTLYDGTTVKSQDYFFVVGTGATVAWDKSQYTSGSAATISYSISPSYYDTTTYNYEIKILNAYGTVEKTQTISGQSGSIGVTLDSSTYSDGVYYAEIVAVQKSDSAEIVMNYGLAEINSYVTISGNVMAINGTLLSGATVNVSQGTLYLVSTSSATGNFTSSNNWLSGSAINIVTNLSGYQNDTNSFTPIAAAEIPLNITLYPSSLSYSGIHINGITHESQYNSSLPNANAYIKVNGTTTLMATTTSNIAGFYDFGGLVNGTVYDVWSSKTGYGNSSTKQVTAVGV